MSSKRQIVVAVLGAWAVYAVVAFGVSGLWFSSGFFRGVLALFSFPIVISVVAAAAAFVVAVAPVPKVPLSYNLRNLQVRWKTTIITGLAFTLVVALLTVMLAFVRAMDRMTEGSAQPGNVMVLSDGATDEVISNLPGSFQVAEFEQRLQDLVERDDVDRHVASREVYAILSRQTPKSQPGEGQRFVYVRGLRDPVVAAKGHGIELAQGQWWSPAGTRTLADGKTVAFEAVIGADLAQAFGQDKKKGPVGPGQILDVGGKKWYLVGVMKETASACGSEIWTRDDHIMDNDARLFSREVYAILNHQLPNAPKGGRQRRFVQVRGLRDPVVAAKIHGIELAHGQWWRPAGARTLADGKTVAFEAVIGAGLAQTFGQDKNEGPVGPGEILDISGKKWYVVGVMKETASAFGSEIWTRDGHIMDNYGRQNTYSTYVFRTRDPEAAKQAAVWVKDFRGGRGFQGYTESEYYARLNATNAQFLVAFIFVAIIMAIGGVLGVMNTMFAAISHRAKDIGVLRLLGFSRWQVLMSFMLESVLIALAGGVLGLGLGYLADGYTASSIISGGAGGGGKSVVLKLIVDLPILTIGLVFALIMGALGGLLPSLSAMRLRPLESLR